LAGGKRCDRPNGSGSMEFMVGHLSPKCRAHASAGGLATRHHHHV
jgi:hypothetical protein